jgi:peptidoglycan/LPS O-acetylase OafA/YrhL
MTTLILYGSYLVVIAAGVAVMHMAFRTSQWRRRELPRRFIGDTTVLGLFALFVLVAGAADLTPWQTWLGQVGGFVVAAIVKIAFVSYDAQRHAELGREGHGNEGQNQ